MLGFKSPVICTRFLKCKIDLFEMLGGVANEALSARRGLVLSQPDLSDDRSGFRFDW